MGNNMCPHPHPTKFGYGKKPAVTWSKLFKHSNSPAVWLIYHRKYIKCPTYSDAASKRSDTMLHTMLHTQQREVKEQLLSSRTGPSPHAAGVFSSLCQ